MTHTCRARVTLALLSAVLWVVIGPSPWFAAPGLVALASRRL